MTTEAFYFAARSIGLSRIGGRKPCCLLNAARHNLRELQAEYRTSSSIDPADSHLNVVLVGPSTASEVRAQADELLAEAAPGRLRRDHCQAIESVFSLPVGLRIDSTAYFEQCLRWLSKALPLPVLTAVLHRDEPAQHMHVLQLPISEGRHTGSSLIARPKLKLLRSSFFDQVAGPAGLKREGAKLRGSAKRRAVADVLQYCLSQNLPNLMGPLWPPFSAAIERDPTDATLALQLYGRCD